MNTPFPPPPAAPEKKRKLWPWFLGGCLTLIVLGGLAVAAMFYFGAKAVSAGGKEIVSQVPAVEEHFGAVTDAGMDFGAMMEASQAGQSVMIFNITGEKGEGRLVIETDPATQAFKSATLNLPSGETVEVDAATLKQLQNLQP
jgi:hypothetical protein